MVVARFSHRLNNQYSLHAGVFGRWKLWAVFAVILLICACGTWVSGQYKIGRLDILKNKYDSPIQNFAGAFGSADPHSLEYDLLDGCKQSQIGSWLQTTDALKFRGPVTGNRIDVDLDAAKAHFDLNGKEISLCVQDDIEDLQFNIGSMVNTWAIILLLVALSFGLWAGICFYAHRVRQKEISRNLYAETLAAQREAGNNTGGDAADFVDSTDHSTPDDKPIL